jgi:hypothetical protein
LSAWQLKPIEKPKYKIYSTAQLRSVALELPMISETMLMLRYVSRHSSKPMLAAVG